MKETTKSLILIGAGAIIFLIVGLFVFDSKTPEQIRAKEEAKVERMKARAEIDLEQHRQQVERLKAQAEIEAQKPVEVRTAEIQADAIKSQTTTGEAILGTAGIAAGAYIFTQLLK